MALLKILAYDLFEQNVQTKAVNVKDESTAAFLSLGKDDARAKSDC